MTLNIFGKQVRVLKKKNLGEDAGTDHVLAGYYDPTNSVIAIDESLVGDEYYHTLVHEIVHAVLHRTGVIQSRLSMDVHEIICENIATALTENFKLTKKKDVSKR